jgi:hypothetical protein
MPIIQEHEINIPSSIRNLSTTTDQGFLRLMQTYAVTRFCCFRKLSTIGRLIRRLTWLGISSIKRQAPRRFNAVTVFTKMIGTMTGSLPARAPLRA